MKLHFAKMYLFGVINLHLQSKFAKNNDTSYSAACGCVSWKGQQNKPGAKHFRFYRNIDRHIFPLKSTRIIRMAVELAAMHVTSYIRSFMGRSFSDSHARRTETLRNLKWRAADCDPSSFPFYRQHSLKHMKNKYREPWTSRVTLL